MFRNLTNELRALHQNKAGQFGGTGLLLNLLVLIIFVAIVAVVVTNFLAIVGLTTGLWSLHVLLIPVIFVVLIVGAIAAAAGLFLVMR